MVPYKDGKANHGHSCVKGRFAWGYATHKDRILKPMIRARITDPWREVTWDEAIAHAASEFKRIQAKYGKRSIGGITSSRCTNEETFLVQKLVRAGFGNNNVDTCARVCHSPTGYGLKTTFGTSAGTQDFDSVEQTRRHHRHRRQSDRRASGVRLAHEEAAARRAPSSSSSIRAASTWCARRTSKPPITCRSCPAPTSRSSRRWRTSSSPRGWWTKPSCASAATGTSSRTGRRSSSEQRNSPEAVAKIVRRSGRDRSAARRGSTRPAAMPRSITASASPSTARARPRSWRSPTSPWRPAISAGSASA